MEEQAVIDEEQNELFSRYPKEMDEYFVNKKIVLKTIPTEFLQDLVEVGEIQISSAEQYYDFLTDEITFWSENDKKNRLSTTHYKERLVSAKNYFDNAIKQYESKNKSQGDNYLANSTNALNSGFLYSQTAMAKFVLQYVDKSDYFLRGLRCGLLKDRNTSLNTTVSDIEGVQTALDYINKKIELDNVTAIQQQELSSEIKRANAHFAELNSNYTKAFHEQEERIRSITTQTNEQFDILNNKATEYFAERDKRCQELEKLYDEKLKLEAPAKYWDDMKKSYQLSGGIWFAASVIIAVLIIVGLVALLASIPNLFSEDSHWMDVFKNSAIITIITSVAIYILRITVKMAMSSFHLARDAKERHNLSYFYLALINDKAITDKERALVINALFSRSDSGLLKNDAGPTMSGNVMDLVDTVTKK